MYSCQPSFIRLKITRYVNFTKKGQLILWVLDLIFFSYASYYYWQKCMLGWFHLSFTAVEEIDQTSREPFLQSWSFYSTIQGTEPPTPPKKKQIWQQICVCSRIDASSRVWKKNSSYAHKTWSWWGFLQVFDKRHYAFCMGVPIGVVPVLFFKLFICFFPVSWNKLRQELL